MRAKKGRRELSAKQNGNMLQPVVDPVDETNESVSSSDS